MDPVGASDLIGLDALEMFAEGLDHPEGVAVAADGAIYAGGEAGQIYRVDADDNVREVANTGGFALGLAFDGVGRLYVCDDANHTVWRVEPGSAALEVFSQGTEARPMRVPNYGAFDAHGNYLVSDS